jgi:modified peptide precursor CbpA
MGRLSRTERAESQKTCPAERKATPDGKGSSIVTVELLFFMGPPDTWAWFPGLMPGMRRRRDMNNITTLKQPATSTPAISIRYVCDANGEQVGLSHYLMTEGRKAR